MDISCIRLNHMYPAVATNTGSNTTSDKSQGITLLKESMIIEVSKELKEQQTYFAQTKSGCFQVPI
uniref:Uncharacterized protein n=1 Tax=Rhizophora mucronata TaxID=61149 RepID=A0A2P2Q901_RHIMU